jgi:hypothetical protein
MVPFDEFCVPQNETKNQVQGINLFLVPSPMIMGLNKAVKVCFRSFLLVVLFFAAFASNGLAQERHVAISGSIKQDRKNLEGVKLTLLKNGRAGQAFTTPSSGKFAMPLDVNSEYILEVYKVGYVTKRIAFNTKVPDDMQMTWSFDFVVDLFQDLEGLDKAIFVNPVAKVEFNEQFGEFDYDLDYSMEFQKAEVEVFKQLEQISKDQASEQKAQQIAAQQAEKDRAINEERLRKEAEAKMIAQAKAAEDARKSQEAAAKKAEEERIAKEAAAKAAEEAKKAEEAKAKSKSSRGRAYPQGTGSCPGQSSRGSAKGAGGSGKEGRGGAHSQGSGSESS